MSLAIHSCPPPRTEARCGSRPGDRTVPFSRCAPPLRELGRMPPPAVTRLQHPWITPDDNQECTTRFTAASRQNAPEFSRTTPPFREESRCEDGHRSTCPLRSTPVPHLEPKPDVEAGPATAPSLSADAPLPCGS